MTHLRTPSKRRTMGVRRLPKHERNEPCGQATDSWLVCLEFESSTTENTSLLKGLMQDIYGDSQTPSIGVVWKLGKQEPAQVSSSSLDYGSKLRSPSPKAPVYLNRAMLIFTHSLTLDNGIVYEWAQLASE
ncbi:hypothetical protein TNCV_2641941 [Trichonephila clavipes]|nr:hypothetical protein TNCV_2641941 [Trichonephila clavipes]